MELILNLSLRECLLRGLIGLLLIFAIAALRTRLLIFGLPIVIYLYVTAIIHFCPIKHWWRRFRKFPDDNDNLYWDKDENE